MELLRNLFGGTYSSVRFNACVDLCNQSHSQDAEQETILSSPSFNPCSPSLAVRCNWTVSAGGGASTTPRNLGLCVRSPTQFSSLNLPLFSTTIVYMFFS